MYFKKNKFVMPSMQFFSHPSRPAHYATCTCEKQIVHNSRSIENVISCSIGDVAETPLPNIAMKASSEALDAAQTRMITEKEVRVCISKRTNL